MIDDLDIEVDFGDEDIIEENVFQFELTTYTSLIYNETQNVWYLQTDEDTDESIFIIEDKSEDIEYTEEVEVFGYILTVADFQYYKEIIAIEKE